MSLRFALIGCGAIGTSVLELLKEDADLSVAAIVVPEEGMAAAREAAARVAPSAAVVSSVPLAGIDLVVEAAGHAAIEQHVLPAFLPDRRWFADKASRAITAKVSVAIRFEHNNDDFGAV